MPDLQQQYEELHNRQIRDTEKRIRRHFESAILEVTPLAATITAADGTVFQLANYPALFARITRIMQRMHASVYATTVNGINLGWALSNEKNDLFVDRRLAGRRPTERARQILYNPNHGARNAFIDRMQQGLNISDRVWNTLDGYRIEMEAALGLGVSEGKGATAMASELRQYLNEPDRLFRRVRDYNGRLQLSQAARNYNPGQGVYRSSYKNALRLARTEQNTSYRTADFERWQQLPFVTGVEVRLSNNHPVYDICDELKGKYPKDFKWSGWHPQCRCHAVAVQLSDAEYNKHEDSILGIGEAPEIKGITDPPAKFERWLEQNSDRVKGWRNRPYWMQDNPQFVGDSL